MISDIPGIRWLPSLALRRPVTSACHASLLATTEGQSLHAFAANLQDAGPGSCLTMAASCIGGTDVSVEMLAPRLAFTRPVPSCR